MRSLVLCALGALSISALAAREAGAIQVLLGSAGGSARVSTVNDGGTITGGTLNLVDFASPFLPITDTIDETDGGWIFNSAGSNARAGYSTYGRVGTISLLAFAECEARAELPGQPTLYNFASAEADSSVSWGDDMTVTSPTGGPVVIKAHVVVHADCAFTDGRTSSTNNSLRYSYRLPGVSQTQVTELDNVQDDYLFDETFNLDVNPGVYYISNSLRLGTIAEARVNTVPGWPEDAYSRIDATHTMTITFDVISGGDYTMASGIDLRSVPAPGAAMVLAFSVIASTRRPRRTG